MEFCVKNRGLGCKRFNSFHCTNLILLSATDLARVLTVNATRDRLTSPLLSNWSAHSSIGFQIIAVTIWDAILIKRLGACEAAKNDLVRRPNSNCHVGQSSSRSPPDRTSAIVQIAPKTIGTAVGSLQRTAFSWSPITWPDDSPVPPSNFVGRLRR